MITADRCEFIARVLRLRDLETRTGRELPHSQYATWMNGEPHLLDEIEAAHEARAARRSSQ